MSLVGGVHALVSMLEDAVNAYAIVGGIAVVVRGRARATADIDAVIALPDGGIAMLLERARVHGFELVPETAELAKAGLVRLRSDAGLPADLIVCDDAFLSAVLARAEPVELDGGPIRVASAEDLILMKLEANRPHDLDDALAVRDAADLDREYLDLWSERLGMADRVTAFLTEGGS